VTALTEDRQRELIGYACELISRVREVDPERNRTWLLSLTDRDRWDLLFVLAAMVDPTTPLPVALGWTWELVRDEP